MVRFHPATAYGKLAGPCVAVCLRDNPRGGWEVPTRQIPCQIGGPSPEPVGMFPIFLASVKTPEGALKGTRLSWARAKCKAYMGGDVRITPFFS